MKKIAQKSPESRDWTVFARNLVEKTPINKTKLESVDTHRERLEKIKKIQFGEDGEIQKEWHLKPTPLDLHQNDKPNEKWNFMTSANTPEQRGKYYKESDKSWQNKTAMMQHG